MLFVLKKDKIMAFAVACSTVFVLFLISTIFARNPENSIATSIEQNTITISNELVQENIVENNTNEIE